MMQRPDRSDTKLLLDMMLSIRMVREYLHDVDRGRFDSDPLLQDAVIRRLEIIGEAAARVSRETCEYNPEIPWRAIVGMRNRIVHEYFRIDLDIVWQVVHQDLPDLERNLEPLIPTEDEL